MVTDTIMMIRPKRFGYNEETAQNNTFQKIDGNENWDDVAQQALEEFDAFAQKLRDYEINVEIIEDRNQPMCPDAIFPNNWISTHSDGTLVTYPMYSEKRRKERREDILELLEEQYSFAKRYTFEHYEEKGMYLEGTGSMVLDRHSKIVYACLSDRTDIRILDKFVVLMGYRKCIFHAISNETAVYHTNVVMALGQEFALVGTSLIPDQKERIDLINTIEASGKEVIELSVKQINSFAGNALELKSKLGERFLVMSEQAFKSLELHQIKSIEKYATIIYAPIYTIEKYGGGSTRCMLAEIFYPSKP